MKYMFETKDEFRDLYSVKADNYEQALKQAEDFYGTEMVPANENTKKAAAEYYKQV